MFTGIVQNKAVIVSRKNAREQVRFAFKVSGKGESRRIKLGQSIAVNGVCLTVAKVTETGFEADAMKATLEATTLGEFKKGTAVNIERSLKYGDEMGGHLVTGHVDGVAEVLKIKTVGANFTFTFSIPEGLDAFIAKKGSVALDGISLTIQSVRQGSFDVGIIPHTFEETNMKSIRVGSKMNVEIDLVARYLKKFEDFLPAKKSKLTISKLIQQGF